MEWMFECMTTEVSPRLNLNCSTTKVKKYANCDWLIARISVNVFRNASHLTFSLKVRVLVCTLV